MMCMPTAPAVRFAVSGLGFQVWGVRSGCGGQGGLVFKAHRLAYHSTLGWRVIQKRRVRAVGIGVGVSGALRSRAYKATGAPRS